MQYEKQPLEEKTYVDAILKNDPAVLEELYRRYLPIIVTLVHNYGGNTEDAKDVFQDALIVIFEKAQRADFKLTSSFKTYLYSICRFICMRKMGKKHRRDVTFEQVDRLIDEQDIELLLIEEEKWSIYQHHFKTLGVECQQVLTLFFKGVKMREIAKQMGYTEKFAKSKKYLCKNALFKKIQTDSKYKELI